MTDAPQKAVNNGRDEKGRFAPGNKANPAGRPRAAIKGLAEYIREQTGNGKTLADFYLGVFNDPDQQVRERMEAADWLADRGFGKPVQINEHTGEDGAPITVKVLRGVSVEDL